MYRRGRARYMVTRGSLNELIANSVAKARNIASITT